MCFIQAPTSFIMEANWKPLWFRRYLVRLFIYVFIIYSLVRGGYISFASGKSASLCELNCNGGDASYMLELYTLKGEHGE